MGGSVVRVGRIRSRRARVGRVRGFIGVRDGCEGEVEGREGR